MLAITAFMSDVTRILAALQQGDPTAAEELLPLVYEELRKLAAYKMAHEPPGQTLQATALVHEAWLRLVASHSQEWRDRKHFFAAAAKAMRRILVDKARRRKSQKHGGDLERVEVEAVDITSGQPEDKLLLVNDALERLAADDPAQAEVVKLRFFVGLENKEIAALLGVSDKTVQRHWNFAKVRLYQEIQRQR